MAEMEELAARILNVAIGDDLRSQLAVVREALAHASQIVALIGEAVDARIVEVPVPVKVQVAYEPSVPARRRKERYDKAGDIVASRKARAEGRRPAGQTIYRCLDCGYLALGTQRAGHATEKHDLFEPTEKQLEEMYEVAQK